MQKISQESGDKSMAENYLIDVAPTGDTWSLVIYAVLFLLSLAVIVTVVAVSRKNNKKDK